MISLPVFFLWVALSFLFGFIEYGIYRAGVGFYGEDNYVIVGKLFGYLLRFVFSLVFALCFIENSLSIEVLAYSFGFYFVSSLPAKGTYFQLKRFFEKEYTFWFFSHSTNHMIKLGGTELIILDTCAFVRSILFLFGYIMLFFEYCN